MRQDDGAEFISASLCLLCQCVDLLGKTRLLAGSSVLVIDVVRSRLIDGLVCCNEEVFRLVCIAGCNSVVDAADGATDARLFRNIAGTTLGVRLYTQNGCLDIWQIVHPLNEKCTALFYHTAL